MSLQAVARRPDAAASHTLSLLTVSTLFPNPERPQHGAFVATRLRHLIASGEATAEVIAPVPFLPPGLQHREHGRLWRVPPHRMQDGIPVYHPRYLAIPKFGMHLTPYTLYACLARALSNRLRQGAHYDLIDAHYFYPDGVAAVWLGARFGIPVTVTARGTDISLLPQFAGPRRLIIDAAQHADGLITVCAALKDSLASLGIPAGRIRVLRNGVDLIRFSPQPREAVRRKLGLSRTTLASVGWLIERKGHHHVISALRDLPETDLLIVGEGPERAALERRAQQCGVAERVRFLGALPQAALADVYTAADALVLASSREGWANVLLEAMACGTPVVASAVWGTPEVVSAPEAGVLMARLDADGVTEAVRRLLAAPPARSATRAYAEQFSWDETTAGQLQLFREILSQPNTAA